MKMIISMITSWVFFTSGIIVEEPFFRVLLLSIARVLPSTLRGSSIYGCS
jgi:hypothetical protein